MMTAVAVAVMAAMHQARGQARLRPAKVAMMRKVIMHPAACLEAAQKVMTRRSTCNDCINSSCSKSRSRSWLPRLSRLLITLAKCLVCVPRVELEASVCWRPHQLLLLHMAMATPMLSFMAACGRHTWPLPSCQLLPCTMRAHQAQQDLLRTALLLTARRVATV